jgi:lysophospholipase L1-like esterase/drug/metabolite transporter superfamily protein YnfA
MREASQEHDDVTPRRRRKAWRFALTLMTLLVAAAGIAGQIRIDLEGEEAPALAAARLEAGVRDANGIRLEGRARLVLRDENDATRRVERIEVAVEPLAPGAILELEMRAANDAATTVALITGDPRGAEARDRVRIAQRDRANAGLPLAIGVAPAAAPAAMRRLALLIDDESLRVQLDGVAIATAESTLAHAGAISFVAPAGSWRLADLVVEGRHSNATPFRREESMQARAAHGRVWLEVGGRLLVAALITVFLLRALCTGSPSWRESLAATGLGLAVALLAWIPAALGGAAPSLPMLAITALTGLIVALVRLRREVNAPAAGSRVARFAIAAAVVVVTISGLVVAHERSLESLAARARATIATADGAPASRPGATRLDAGNALSFAGRYRDVRLACEIELEPGALFLARLRSANEEAEGIALRLSAAAGVRSGFFVQDVLRNRAIGERSDPLGAGRRLRLVVEARADSFVATVDGEEVARATTLAHPIGGVVLLADRGVVSLGEVELAPLPAALAARSVPRASRALALVLPAIVILALLAVIATLATRGAFSQSLAASAFVILPLPFVMWSHGVEGELDKTGAALAFGAAMVVALLQLQLHARRTTAARFLLWFAATPLLVLAAIATLAGLGGPSRGGQVAGVAEVGLEPVRDELLWLDHPIPRRQNGYLVRHEFRGRRFEVGKRQGVRRVIALGTSSTWGFGIPVASGKDWPTLVERRLTAQGAPRVEVMNAAYPGTTGSCLYRFLRDGLAPFSADAVVLSLTYNDSFAHTQWDQEAYFASCASTSRLARLLGDPRSNLAVDRGRDRLSRLLPEFERRAADGATTLEVWRALGFEEDEPPAVVRFAAMLRRFADLCEERGMSLVLVKEPLAGDRPKIWKQEYHEVMDRLADERGIAVADPTPLLAANGGAKLFLPGDEIHPSAEGNEFVAESITAVLRKALDD